MLRRGIDFQKSQFQSRLDIESWFAYGLSRQRSDEHPYKFAPDEFVDAPDDVGIAFWGIGIVFEVSEESLKNIYAVGQNCRYNKMKGIMMNTPTVSIISPEETKELNISRIQVFSEMFKNAGFSGDLANWKFSNEEELKKQLGLIENPGFSGDLSHWKLPNEEELKKQLDFMENAMAVLKDTLGVENDDAFVMAYAQYQEHKKAQAALQVTIDSPSLSNP